MLRWILVVPAGFLGFWVAETLGMFAFGLTFDLSAALALDERWNSLLVLALLGVAVLFTGLAGMMVVGIPAAVAPNRREHVARCAFLVGLAVACSIAFDTGAGSMAAVALVCAAVGGAFGIGIAEELGRYVDRVVASAMRLAGG